MMLGQIVHSQHNDWQNALFAPKHHVMEEMGRNMLDIILDTCIDNVNYFRFYFSPIWRWRRWNIALERN